MTPLHYAAIDTGTPPSLTHCWMVVPTREHRMTKAERRTTMRSTTRTSTAAAHTSASAAQEADTSCPASEVPIDGGGRNAGEGNAIPECVRCMSPAVGRLVAVHSERVGVCARPRVVVHEEGGEMSGLDPSEGSKLPQAFLQTVFAGSL